MAIQEERFIALEQTVASLRVDFLQVVVENTHNMSALNKAMVQQEQKMRDINHEITILTGVVGAQGQDIKSMIQSIGELDIKVDRLDQRFTSQESKLDNLNQHFTSRLDNLDQRFTSQESRLDNLNQHFTSRLDNLDRRFTFLEGKFDQMLQMVTALTKAANEKPI